ncbi:hypothetical protein [Clostridium thailandense]|uniref:hypothetical protein n=1 Tax=Clostridium thailandense TaxID=2794346 RepID=UPI00398A0361
MENITEHLKNIKILDNNDIIKLKNYIRNKYPDNTTVKNAQILSDTIHKIIYVKLDGLPEDFKSPIKIATLKNTLGNSKSLITLYDIFSTCLVDENLRKNFTDQLTGWVNSHIEVNIKVEELDSYLEIDNIKNKEAAEVLEVKNSNINIVKGCQENINVSIIKAGFLTWLGKFKLRRHLAVTVICIFAIPLYALNRNFYINVDKASIKEESYILQVDKSTSNSIKYTNAHLPEYMRYKPVNEKKLKIFLGNHKSLLSKEPYFSTIISVAKEFNLNPVVLFSITGQEQSFVPSDNENAFKIANNPFNVYHSWKEYNTNIRDSSSIAARTVINLSQDISKDEDPFLCIGKKYAEDKNWGDGVKSIFKELNDCVN